MRPLVVILAGLVCLIAGGAAQADTPPARTDQLGDPLPPGARFRLGTTRFWHRVGVEGMAFSPDGTMIATGGCDELRIWDTQTGKERLCSTQVTKAHALAFSPDGKLLAAGGGFLDDWLHLLAMPDGKSLHKVKAGHDGVQDMLFLPDGKILITTGRDGRVRFWDVGTGRQVRSFAAHEKEVESLALSPDGKKLLTGSQDKTARLWELATGKELAKFPGANWGNSVAFHPDGALIAVASDELKIHLWDLATGKKVRELHGDPTHILTVAFSPDGKFLASAHGEEHRVVGPDGKEKFEYRESPTVILWDPATGKQVRSWGRQGGRIHGLRFSPDGKLLATSGSKLRMWETAAGQEVPALPGHQWDVSSLAVSPDGRTLASRSSDKTVRTWDIATGKETNRHLLRERYLSEVRISPDGKTVVWGSEKGLRMADLGTGKMLPGLDYDATTPAFSADGRLLAASGEKVKVYLFDFPGRRLIRGFQVKTDWLMGLAISPDGKLLAGASYEGIVFLLSADGKVIRRLEGHRGWCSCVAFSPDGSRLLTGGDDGTARLWAIPDGKSVAVLKAEGQTLAVAYSPDGRMVAAGQSGPQALVQVWEVATLGERVRFSGHKATVDSLAFSPDGKLLFSGSNDTTILAWEVLASDTKPARTADELAKAWAEIGSSDAKGAFAAVRAMIGAPEEGAAFLSKHLRPVVAPDPKRIDRLLTDLDDNQFEVRDKARKELEKLEETARPSLESALAKGRPSLEQRTRIEQLLAQLDPRSPDRLRAWRAVEVLEHIATPEARRLLEELAAGAPAAQATREARAARDRFAARKQP
jgi:WD40 repeat protein